MPRTKESDDESEIKTGRRSRAVTGTNVVDSPLRRSTRNRQQINQDVSPDSANNTAGPLTRTTRRKIASQEATTTETTRSLRSRKTSITSDTSESHDFETCDVKRTTRRSTTAATAPETPTSVRIRRSVRAGSESKTIPSPTKTSRKTRASSLDLEERDNKLQSNLQAAHNSTPVKLRKRASIIPSEPVLIEEAEKDDKDSLEESLRLLTGDDEKMEGFNKDDDNITVESSIKTTDSQSPIMRLNLSRSVTPENQKDIEKLEENTDNLPVNTLKSSNEFGLNSILEEPNDLEPKQDAEILNKSDYNINEKMSPITPKVMIEKMKYPLSKESSEKSPGNKENEKGNVTVQIKKSLKFPSSHEVPTQRKSLMAMTSKKISIIERLNKSTDDRTLKFADDSSKKSLSVSTKSLEKFPDIESVGENIYSVCSGPKNESIIIMEEIRKPTDCIENSESNFDVKEESNLMDTSSDCINNKNDVLDEASAKNNTIEPISIENNELSVMVIDEEETNTTKDNSKIIDQQSNVTSTITSPPKTNKEDQPSSPVSQVLIESVESGVDKPEQNTDMECEEEKTNEDNINVESFINKCSIERLDKLTEQRNNLLLLERANEHLEEFNQMIENESSSDLNDLFKDIPADEWSNDETSQSSRKNNFEKKEINDNTKEKDIENIEDEKEKKTNKESVEDFELVLVDKKAWEAAEQERIKMIETNNDSDSTDTILMQLIECRKSIDPPASPLFEEPMDTGGDETETETEQTVKENMNKSRSSLSKRLSAYGKLCNQSNEDDEKELEKEETSNLNKSNVSMKKSPVKRLTPIKIGSPIEMKKNASPTKSVTDSPLIRKKKSLDSSLVDKKSLKNSFLNTSSSQKLSNKTLDLEDTALESEDDKTDENDEQKCASKSPKKLTRNSLNKSKIEDNNCAMDTEEDDIEQQEEKKSPLNSAKKVNKSLNKSASRKSQNNLSNVLDEDVENVLQVSRQSKNQNLNDNQSKLLKNYSIVAQINSDSEVDSLESESSDNSGPLLPAFLYGDSSSSNEAEESDSSSIDSDVAREYNLNGSSISEYSDDDVPGDICRASETESSGDEDDYADDMADFIVDDDEIDEEMEDEETEDEENEDEENENEENEDEENEDEENKLEEDEDEENKLEEDEEKSDENEDDEDIEVVEQNNDVELQGSESDNIAQIRSVKKHLEFNTSDDHNEDKSLDKSKNKITNSESKVLRKNKFRQSWNELCNDSLATKTPNKEVEELVNTEDGKKKEMSSKKKSRKSDVSELNKSGLNKLDTPKSVKSAKKNKSEMNIEDSFHVEDMVPITSKLAKTSSFNQSMLAPFTVSPETKSLLKEKFNDTLPALKLEQYRKDRRSSLFMVDENFNDENDEPVETRISKKSIDGFNEEKKKKKKKKKIVKNDVDVEDALNEPSEDFSILSKHTKKNLEKKKKKKTEEADNSEVNKISLKKKKKKNEKSSEEEVEEKPLKKNKNKKKSVPVDEDDQVFGEIKNKKRTKTENNVPNKKTRCLSFDTYFGLDDECHNEVLKGSKKINKLKGKLSFKANSEMGKSSLSDLPMSMGKTRVKRLSEDILESLSDVPVQPKKRRKLSVDQKVLPSRKMFDSKNPKPENLSIEDQGYIPLSSSGSTTSFYVMNLEKPKKSKKLAAVYSFRERMLRRNPRQPVSAYLMYQQKLKASNHDKY